MCSLSTDTQKTLQWLAWKYSHPIWTQRCHMEINNTWFSSTHSVQTGSCTSGKEMGTTQGGGSGDMSQLLDLHRTIFMPATLVIMRTLSITHISQRQTNSRHSRGATRVLTFITKFHLELLRNSTIKSHNILFYSVSKLSYKIFTTRKFNTGGEFQEKKQHPCCQLKELRNVNISLLNIHIPMVQKKQALWTKNRLYYQMKC
jgi:hypothetical protein